MKCYRCENIDTRPYGPGGQPICFPCMKSSDELERIAEANYGALLDANEAISPSGAVVIGGHEGPQPFNPGCGGEHHA